MYYKMYGNFYSNKNMKINLFSITNVTCRITLIDNKLAK